MMPGGLLAAGKHTLLIRVVNRDGKGYVQSPGITILLSNDVLERLRVLP